MFIVRLNIKHTNVIITINHYKVNKISTILIIVTKIIYLNKSNHKEPLQLEQGLSRQLIINQTQKQHNWNLKTIVERLKMTLRYFSHTNTTVLTNTDKLHKRTGYTKLQ